jgi:hypothetical protein
MIVVTARQRQIIMAVPEIPKKPYKIPPTAGPDIRAVCMAEDIHADDFESIALGIIFGIREYIDGCEKALAHPVKKEERKRRMT